MKSVTVTVQARANPKARLLVPCGINDSYEQCVARNFKNASVGEILKLDLGDQAAVELAAVNIDEPIVIDYEFVPSDQPLDSAFWTIQENCYSRPSESLRDDVLSKIDTNETISSQVFQLIKLARKHFEYGHVDDRFNDGESSVPAICGVQRGSCVDINTYLLAGAQALGIPVQYVAGYWFHPEKTQTEDMHCWLVFNIENKLVPWDLAHHLKWGVDELSSGLNPAGGRRVGMTFGRGLSVQSYAGPVTISHFSEPVWVLPNGLTENSELVISIQE